MYLKTLVLGIVEGLTEFIPVSSTAHLLLSGRALGIPSGQFLEAISISIQSGAILAAVFYFFKTLWYNRSLWGKILVGFLPTAIVGLLLYPLIKNLFDNTVVIAWALIIVGIVLVLIKPVDSKRNIVSLNYKEAFLIGLSQIASFIPGVSRAGATLIGGTALRIPREIIVTFSFLLAIPTIIGAGVIELGNVAGLSKGEYMLIAFGALVSFLTALITIRFFIRFLTEKPLSWFGWYRIVLGVLVLIFIK